MTDVISRQEAAEKGLRRYFTGMPCSKGHVAERLVSTQSCCQCQRELNREWKRANATRVREISRDTYRRNKDRTREKRRERFKAWRERNIEACRASVRRYLAENPAKRNQYRAERRAAVKRQTPPWANRAEIARIYKLAADLTAQTGINHEVDHIVPLKGRTVSGLHVEANLQVVTAEANRKKSNRLPQDADVLPPAGQGQGA